MGKQLRRGTCRRSLTVIVWTLLVSFSTSSCGQNGTLCTKPDLPGCSLDKCITVQGSYYAVIGFVLSSAIESQVKNRSKSATDKRGRSTSNKRSTGKSRDKESEGNDASAERILVASIAGFAYGWAKCLDLKIKSTQTQGYVETKKSTDYTPNEGTVVAINTFSFDPATVGPGDAPKLKCEYRVMTPKDEELTVIVSLTLGTRNEDTKEFVTLASSQNEDLIKQGTHDCSSLFPAEQDTKDVDFEWVLKVAVKNQSEKAASKVAHLKVRSTQVVASNERGTPISEPVQSEGTGDTGTTTDPTIQDPLQRPYLVVTGSRTNLRSLPTTDADILQVGISGETYPYLNELKMNGVTWHKIRLGDGRVAWVHSNFSRIER